MVFHYMFVDNAFTCTAKPAFDASHACSKVPFSELEIPIVLCATSPEPFLAGHDRMSLVRKTKLMSGDLSVTEKGSRKPGKGQL